VRTTGSVCSTVDASGAGAGVVDGVDVQAVRAARAVLAKRLAKKMVCRLIRMVRSRVVRSARLERGRVFDLKCTYMVKI
jgi:hypothetical protein